ncbi:MAG: OmpA family protein, partial [Sinomicrobium sp.]|nr:OmpA family protein [Sinomicrobium sp.]
TKYLIGTVYDPLNSRPIPYATIHLLNSTCGVNLEVQSDASGHYRLPLVPDCCINIRVEKEGFQTYTALEALCTDKTGNIKGSTSILLKPDPKPKPQKLISETNILISRGAFDDFERSKNTSNGDASPAFILNVYYDSGRTSVKEESVEHLKKLLKLLEENPTLIVEIGAHTDSKGSTPYNNDLSQRRAENVVKYLVSQGIDAKRLRAKGYGESQLINDCDDDKDCSEEENQVNRRTEFRIIGSLEQPE